jgi:hypothetical protein
MLSAFYSGADTKREKVSLTTYCRPMHTCNQRYVQPVAGWRHYTVQEKYIRLKKSACLQLNTKPSRRMRGGGDEIFHVFLISKIKVIFHIMFRPIIPWEKAPVAYRI